jgi:pyridoxal phosphate enzyme (YggS family)
VDSRSLAGKLRDRLDQVEARIHAACRRAGRQRGEVTLVAVTKTVSSEVAACMLELGVSDLGENRPQELWRKAAELPGPIRWHMIGHLQRNKVERTVPLVCLVHAVDSLRLLQALAGEASKLGRRLPVLLEVNASRESAKHGWRPDEVPSLSDHLNGIHELEVGGLMTMAAYEEDPERCRPTFREARELLSVLRARTGLHHSLNQLSMGMSNDFEIAIEEGATLIRLGTVLFEGLEENLQ